MEINEVKKIEGAVLVDARETDCKLYNAHSHRDAWLEEGAREAIFKWICDNCDYVQGQYCFNVKINNRRGFLFCEYSRDDGFGGIRFAVKA